MDKLYRIECDFDNVISPFLYNVTGEFGFTVPATPNFKGTRYIVELPAVYYLKDAAKYPVIAGLARVEAIPASGQFRTIPALNYDDYLNKNLLEFNAAQAGLSFTITNFWTIGSVVRIEDLEDTRDDAFGLSRAFSLAYGIGVNSNPGEAVVTNADTAFTVGFYRFPAGSTGNPFSNDAQLEVYRNGAGELKQEVSDPTQTAYGKMKVRFYSGSAWGSWMNLHYGEVVALETLTFTDSVVGGTLGKKRPVAWLIASETTGSVSDTRIPESNSGLTQIGKDGLGAPFYLWTVTNSSNIFGYWRTTAATAYSSATQYKIKYAGMAGLDLRRKEHNLTGAKSWYWYTFSGDTTIKVATYGPGLTQSIIDSESVRSAVSDVAIFGNLQYLTDAVSGVPTGRALVITTDGYLQIFDFNGTTITAGATYDFTSGTLVTTSHDAVDIEWLQEDATHDYFAFSWIESSPSAEVYFAVVKIAKVDDTFTLVQGPTNAPNKVNKATYGSKILPIANHGFFLYNGEQASAGLNRMLYYKYDSATDTYLRTAQLDGTSYFQDLQAIYLAACRAVGKDDYAGFYLIGRVNAAFNAAGHIPEYGYETEYAYLDQYI